MVFKEFNKLARHFCTTHVLLQTLLVIIIMLLYVRTASAMSVQSKANTQNESQQPHVEKYYEMYIEQLTPSADDNHAPLLISVKETVELYLPFHKNTSKNAYSCYQQENVQSTCEKNETDNYVKTESSNATTCEYQDDDDDLHESDNNGDVDDEIFTYPAGVELVWLYLTKRHNLDELEWSGCGGKWRPEWSIPLIHTHSSEQFSAKHDNASNENSDINEDNKHTNVSYLDRGKSTVQATTEESYTQNGNNNCVKAKTLAQEKMKVETERQEKNKSNATEVEQSQEPSNDVSNDDEDDDDDDDVTNKKLAELRHYLSHHVVCSHSAVSMCVGNKRSEHSYKIEYREQTKPEYNTNQNNDNNNYYYNKMLCFRSSLSQLFDHIITRKRKDHVSGQTNNNPDKNNKVNKYEESTESKQKNLEQKERMIKIENQQAAKEFQWIAQFVSSLTSSPLSWTKDTPRHIRPSGLLFSFSDTEEKLSEESQRTENKVCSRKEVSESSECSQRNISTTNENSVIDKEYEDKSLHRNSHDRDYSSSHYNTESSATKHPSWCSYHLVSHDTLCTQHISHWLNAGRSSHTIEQVIPNPFFNSLIGSFYIYLDSPFHHFTFALRRSNASAAEANKRWRENGVKRSEEKCMRAAEEDRCHPSRVIVAETRMSFVTDDEAHLRTLEMLWNSEETIRNLNNKEFSLYSKLQNSNRTNLIHRLLALARNTNSQQTRQLEGTNKAHARTSSSTFSRLSEEEEALSRQLILPELFSKLNTRGHDHGSYEIYLQPQINYLLDMTIDITTLQKLIHAANTTIRNYLREYSTISTFLMFPLHLIRPTLFSMQSFDNTTTIDYAHVDVDTNTLTIVLSTNFTSAHIDTYVSHYISLLERILWERCALTCINENCDREICKLKYFNHYINNYSNINFESKKINAHVEEETNTDHGVLLAHFDITHGWAGLKEMPRDANSYRVLPQPTALLTRQIKCKHNISVNTKNNTNTSTQEEQQQQKNQEQQKNQQEELTVEAKEFELTSLPSSSSPSLSSSSENSRSNQISDEESLYKCLEMCKECDNNIRFDNIDHAHAIAALMHGLRKESFAHSSKSYNFNKYIEALTQNSHKNKVVNDTTVANKQHEHSIANLKELYSEKEQSCLCHTWLRAREVSGSTIPTPDPAMVFNVVAL